MFAQARHRSSALPSIVVALGLVFATPAAASEFQPYELYRQGSEPRSVAIGDVTSDGRNDVVMMTRYGNDPDNDFKLWLYRQEADATLTESKLAPTSDWGADMGLEIGDVDGDGRNDAAVATGAGVEAFLQTGAGTLAGGVPLPGSPPQARHLAMADLTGDGKNDFGVAAFDVGVVALTKRPDGGYVSTPLTTDLALKLDSGDFDSDGRDELAVLTNWDIQTFEADGSGGFGRRVYPLSTLSTERATSIAVGDVTGDGREDVVLTRGGNRPNGMIGVFPQLPGGGLDDTPALYPSYDIPTAVRAADTTLDGRADVVTVHSGWERVGVYPQLASGQLGTEELFPTPFGYSTNTALAVGDVNSDDWPDIAFALTLSGGAQGLVVLRQIPGNRPPDCSGVHADPAALLKPKGDLRIVSLRGASDPDGDPLGIQVTGVTQDEPVTGGSDRTSPDATWNGALGQLRLRAERNARGDGRLYNVTLTASDGQGGTCSATVAVSVRRHANVPAVDSAPPSYNSFGP